jgi:hypothetical protein
MSDAGLHSSLYSRIREYAELLDQVLLDFEVGTADAPAPREMRIRLGRLLATLGNRVNGDLQAELLASLVREADRPTLDRLAEIGRDLVAGRSDPSLRRDLEQLARTLEQERARTFAKIRGQ